MIRFHLAPSAELAQREPMQHNRAWHRESRDQRIRIDSGVASPHTLYQMIKCVVYVACARFRRAGYGRGRYLSICPMKPRTPRIPILFVKHPESARLPEI